MKLLGLSGAMEAWSMRWVDVMLGVGEGVC